MVDMTMCTYEKCPKSKKCYRFNAKPNPYRQSYFADIPDCNKDNNYQYFSNMWGRLL